MPEKTCLITGGTSGIGLVTARELAAQGMRVAIAGRNAQKGQQVVAEIRAYARHDRVEFMQCDLESLAQVRTLARNVRARFPRLDVLINNAGLLQGRRRETAEGYEVTFGVNHLAHFLLTNLLIDHLRKSAPARVIVVSSEAHRGKPLNLDDLNAKQKYGVWSAYQQSKLANLHFTFELARRLAGTRVTANALHPGFVRTAFGKNNGLGYALLINVAGALLGIPVEKGAKTSIYLASSPEVERVTGGYFIDSKPAAPMPAAADEAAAKRLWEMSERFAGLVP